MPSVGFGLPGLEGKTGKFLSEDEAIYEGIVHSVVEYHRDRWGEPEFGTTWIDALEYNVPEAIPHADTQAYIGTGRVTTEIERVASYPSDAIPADPRTDIITEIHAAGQRITLP